MDTKLVEELQLLLYDSFHTFRDPKCCLKTKLHRNSGVAHVVDCHAEEHVAFFELFGEIVHLQILGVYRIDA